LWYFIDDRRIQRNDQPSSRPWNVLKNEAAPSCPGGWKSERLEAGKRDPALVASAAMDSNVEILHQGHDVALGIRERYLWNCSRTGL